MLRGGQLLNGVRNVNNEPLISQKLFIELFHLIRSRRSFSTEVLERFSYHSALRGLRWVNSHQCAYGRNNVNVLGVENSSPGPHTRTPEDHRRDCSVGRLKWMPSSVVLSVVTDNKDSRFLDDAKALQPVKKHAEQAVRSFYPCAVR